MWKYSVTHDLSLVHTEPPNYDEVEYLTELEMYLWARPINISNAYFKSLKPTNPHLFISPLQSLGISSQLLT